MSTETDYDVFIIGAGIVGLTAALALCESNLRIAILDRQMPTIVKNIPEIEQRVSAIAPVTIKIFHALKAWDEMKSLRMSPYREMFVWDAKGTGQIHFDSAEVGTAALGYIIENTIIQSALLKQLNKHTAITWLCPALLKDIQLLENHALITLENGEQITCKLMVGADGATSQVREISGIKLIEWDYDHSSLIATVQTEQPHKDTAWQIFLSTGPLAFLPLRDPHHCSIVWSTTPQEAEYLKDLNKTDFAQKLTTEFTHRLGKINLLGERQIYPLRMRHAKQYTLNRLALIGDAAHTIHPLAGQGLNLGILDAVCLAEVIVQAKMKNRDIGAHYILRRYERWRKGGNISMLATVELFKRLFGIKLPPVQLIRNSGLNLVNHSTFLKSCIMKQAMGLTGDLPQLAQGLMPEN